MARILAIDFGEKRTGIAVTDELQIIASGLTTIPSATAITFLKDYFEKEFAKKLSAINFPQDKFLLISIFGKDAEEFVSVAKILEEFADGFELNLSCPAVSQISNLIVWL